MGQETCRKKERKQYKVSWANTKNTVCNEVRLPKGKAKVLLLQICISITGNATSWVKITEDNIQNFCVDSDD